MYSSLVLGLAFIAGAPAAKDLPRTEAVIIGDWIVSEFLLHGADATPTETELATRFAFSKDGTLRITVGKNAPEVYKYTLNAQRMPAEIDLDRPIGLHKKTVLSRGIFKVMDGVLTVSIIEDKVGSRPRNFDDEAPIRIRLKKASK